MSNLSELLPAGAGAKSASFVASGTLGSGVTVALNSDGTVSVAAQSTITTSIGTPTEYDTSGWYEIQPVAYDPVNNKVVISYNDFATYDAYAIVGTVSGSTISFGTPVLFTSGVAVVKSIAYDASTGNVFLMFKDNTNSGYTTGILGTISGTTISFGTKQVVKSASINEMAVCYDPNSEKLIAFYLDDAVLITTSGTTFTVGTETQFESTAATSYLFAVYDTSTSRVVVSYKLGSLVKSAVGTVGASTVTFGTPVTADDISTGRVGGAVFDSYNNKVVITYQDNNTSGYGLGIVGTVSGTSISFGTPVIFKSSNTLYPSCAYDTNARKVVVAYSNSSLSRRGEAVILTVSGTSFTFTSSTLITTSRFQTPTTVYNSVDKKVVIASGLDLTNSEAWVFTTGYVDNASERFIGITDQAIADTATGAVIVQGGVSDKLSGLTVGADYYVQADGALSSPTAPDPYNLSGAVYDEVNFSVSGQAATPTAMRFNDDGTKMYVADFSGTIYQYSLSEAFNIATAAYASISYSVSGQESSPRGLAFNDDGTKMFVVGSSAKAVLLYNLGSAFNISTASYSSTSFSVSAIGNPTSLAFSVDGTEMYVTDNNTTDSAHQYSLSTGWDITTASFTSSFTVNSQDGNPTGITFNSDGTQMYVAGQGTDAIYQYNLSTAYSVSSAVYSGTSLSVAAQDIDVGDVVFSSTGAKMYIVGYNTDAVYQYSLNGSTSTVPAGRALSTTSILLEG